MGSHGSKDGAGKRSAHRTEASDGAAPSKLHPDQIETVKLAWRIMVGEKASVADFQAFSTYLGLPTDLNQLCERLFVRLLMQDGQHDQNTTEFARSLSESLSQHKLLCALELISRVASTREKTAFVVQMYSTPAGMLGKAELARLFTDLALLLQFVSDYEVSNYLFASPTQRKGDASPATVKLKPSEIIIDQEDRFADLAVEMLKGLAMEDRAPQEAVKAESGGVIVMSKLNIQIPTVKGVSVNPMNESRAVVEPKTEPTEEELMKSQLERDMRLTKRIVSGLMRSALDFSDKKSGRSALASSSEQRFEASWTDIVDWAVQTVPALVEPISSLFHFKFFQLPASMSEESKKSYKPTAMTPVGLDMAKSDLWGNGIIWALDLFFSEKKSVWKLLYNSTAHGHSLNRFVHHVVGYEGPTVMFIRDTQGHLFGAFVSSPWQISSKFFGDNNGFLFSLDPVFCLKHPSGPERSFVYCFDRKNTHSGFPVGIGFGGTLNAFRLCLQDDLSSGLARQMDTTYEIGTVNPSAAFDVDLIEVWGCGGDAAEMAQARSNFVKEKQTERARKVNRTQAAQGWMNGPDKFIMDLLGKTGSSDAYHDEIKQAKKNMKKQEASSS